MAAPGKSWLVCAALVLSALFPGFCEGQEGPAPPNRPGVWLENATVKVIRTTTLSARVTGAMKELRVREGSLVAAGDEVGLVADEAVRLQVERAEAALRLAQARAGQDIDVRLAQKRAEVADSELERARSANQRIPDTYPLKEVERLQLVADSARLEIERARHARQILEQEAGLAGIELAQARELLDRHRIVVPVGGMVTALEKHPGEWVEPGAPLLQVVDTARLRVEGFAGGEEAQRIRIGQPASVRSRGGTGEEFVVGQVTFVSPESNPVNGQVRVFVEFDNPAGRFRPGMRVEVELLDDGG